MDIPVLLVEEIRPSPVHMVNIPLFTRCLYIQKVVVWDFWTINSIWLNLDRLNEWRGAKKLRCSVKVMFNAVLKRFTSFDCGVCMYIYICCLGCPPFPVLERLLAHHHHRFGKVIHFFQDPNKLTVETNPRLELILKLGRSWHSRRRWRDSGLDQRWKSLGTLPNSHSEAGFRPPNYDLWIWVRLRVGPPRMPVANEDAYFGISS